MPSFNPDNCVFLLSQALNANQFNPNVPDASNLIPHNLLWDFAANRLIWVNTLNNQIVKELFGSVGGYNTVQDEGTNLPQRSIINFQGAGVFCLDDPLNARTNVFITSSTSNGFFAQIADSTPITNTLSVQNLLGAGVGTLSVPANTFQVGDSFHLKVSGLMSSKNNDDLTITLRSNGVILASTGFINLPQTTDKVWELEADFTIRAIGSAGVANINVNGQFIYNKDAALAVEGIGFNSINNTTFNTTILNTLEVDAQWAQANPQNSIYSSNCTLFKTY